MGRDVIGGDADEGYGKVADAFRRNFDRGRELGAAVSVYRDGRKVVDLWGGHRDADRRAPWTADTLVNVFSTTKGVASLAIALAVSRGLLDYDAPVAAYWPDFAQAGKEAVTVRQLCGHQAGLVVVDPPLSVEEVADPEVLAARIARQAPAWEPGTRHGYHALTLGWYQSALLRQVDPQRRTLGRFLADEIAAPLGLELYIGLPRSVDRDRVAQLVADHPWRRLLQLHRVPPRLVLASLNNRSLGARALEMAGPAFEVATFNREQYQRVEMPAANGTATARAIAKLYGAALTGELGLAPSVRQALEAPAVTPTQGVRDLVTQQDVLYSLGFGKPTPRLVFGSSGRAFGWPGAGGSFGFADPDTGIGYAYVMNRMGYSVSSDPRELALRQALFRDTLGARPQR